MPIYEFLCQSCKEKFSVLVRKTSETSSTVCPSCGGSDLQRLVSSFAYHRSFKDIHEDSGEPTLIPRGDFYKDPRNIGRWTEKRFKELGLDMPPEIQKEIQVAREGESPKPESDMLGP
jgi:putative FmdB family regulatory protein